MYGSIRTNHSFLSDTEVKATKDCIPQALAGVEHLILAEAEKPIAFMGIQNGRLEMLFIAPEERGKGIGKQLLQYGFQNYGIYEVTVNEQNPQAVGFYEHTRFETYKRLELGEKGYLYSILYMNLKRQPIVCSGVETKQIISLLLHQFLIVTFFRLS